MVAIVQFFFALSFLESGLNSNFLVFIPKVKDALTVDKFHPIVIGNFLYKIVKKIIANRLSGIISLNQFRFVNGHNVHNCIATTSKCANILDKKCFGGNMAMKIDIWKAFDTLSLGFLFSVLKCFGFNFKFLGGFKLFWLLLVFQF